MRLRNLEWCVVCAAQLMFVGCGGPAASPTGGTATAAKHDHHDHPSEGPHHGELIELGKDEYHAELVHDDEQHTVTIYVLDSSAKVAVPIEAPSLALNLVGDGKPQQYTLAAKPLPTDPAGKCSCFVNSDKAMCEALDQKGTTGRLNLTIAGKAFVGKIVAHEHEHDQHKK